MREAYAIGFRLGDRVRALEACFSGGTLPARISMVELEAVTL